MEAIATTIRNIFEKKGYAFFDGGKPYNVNVFGIRNYGRVNAFDDFICLLYRNSRGKWIWRQYEGTTMPGLTTLRVPVNSHGTAILVPGQYRGAYRIDKHAGKYDALCQRLGQVKVYRDRNRDDQYDLDPATIQEGMFGINIHRAGLRTEQVGGWSAGCQVIRHASQFEDFIKILKSAQARFGNRFTYTLLEKSDFEI
jgi:hypothetical protein